MAKGAEDTAFYRFNRLVSLNEVGGDPGRFGVSVEEFHRSCEEQQRRWPHTMLASSTHDTKRSEDVRARINLLSEMPGTWAAAVRRWSAMNEKHRRNGLPDRNAEHRFYQMLVGTWPLSVERALAYLDKAACEAKQHTRWTQRNPAYDQAAREYVAATMQDAEFMNDLEAFVAPLRELGFINSLAQTLIKLTAPGVPDIYQGTELWDFSLVDPDNRRPVDFATRRRVLTELESLSAEQVWLRRDSGLPKLWLIWRTLALRRRQPQPFEAEYKPLAARGAKATHVVAFSRGDEIVTVAPRLVIGLAGDWSDTTLELPRGEWRNALSGKTAGNGACRLADLLRTFPVALLARKDLA
jgi:(1->4)-alpha-D-glucan 1-alpha-D-glucosylmutase